MNYALKTLMNQLQMCNDLLEKTKIDYQNSTPETACEEEFWLSDIHNLEKQCKELVEAIEILRK